MNVQYVLRKENHQKNEKLLFKNQLNKWHN